MSALLVILLVLATPFAAVWFRRLQARLERWDAEKHALD